MAITVNHSTPADSSFSATGATAWNANHSLVGVGTMAEQNANNVAITGGTISGVAVTGYVPTTRTISTSTGLTGGGDLSADRTIAFSDAAIGTWAATPTSAHLKAAMTDETGSGALVFADGPTLSAPTIDGANPYIRFLNGAAVTNAAGRMWYNGNDGSLNFGMGGGNITQQVGEELFVYGKATATIADSPLQIVYKTGTIGASGVITFAPTISGLTDSGLFVGCATEPIASGDFGRVTCFGAIHGIDTRGTTYGETWVAGDTIWYNPTTGNPTKVKPSAPNIKIQLGTVINVSATLGTFHVEIIHGSSLGGTDDNVQLSTPTGGQVLTYDQTDAYWKNTSLTAGSGISITPAAGGGITIANTSPSSGGTVTSVGGTGTVSGISLSGTVTSSGNLTLGGSLDLSSPPTIGGTTPNDITGATITAAKFVGVYGGAF